MVLLDRFSLAGSFNIITVVTIRINHIYPMTRVMTPESSEICVMRHIDRSIISSISGFGDLSSILTTKGVSKRISRCPKPSVIDRLVVVTLDICVDHYVSKQ